MLQKFFRIGAFRQDADGVAQPGKGVGFALQEFGRRADAVLVESVRGDAEFGDLVHLLGADLQLDALVAGADHGGVDRTIIVLLRRRDIVLEAAGHDGPGGVDDAERAVAGLDIVEDDAEPENVGQLLEADRFALHLGPDRKRFLAPAVDVRHHAVLLQVLDELALDLADQIAVALGQRIEALLDHPIGFRVEGAEGKVFQLLAHFLHAHAAGERCVDVERLLCDAAARGCGHEFQGAHVVQAVGELDQEHADIVGDGEQELAEILRLLGLARHQFQPLQLGQALDQRADLMAKNLVDLGPRRLGVLDGVVQQGCDDGGVIELQPGQDRRDLERVGEIGIAGGAGLRAMRLHGIDIGAVEQVLVRVRVVGTDFLNQVILPHHPARLCGTARRSRRRHRDLLGRRLHLP